jgi:hypothetical protein
MTRVLQHSPSIVNEAPEGDAPPAGVFPIEPEGLARKRINWRRGSFRLWLVASILYVIAVAALNHNELKTQFQNFNRFEWLGSKGLLVPMPCSDSRGVMGSDFAAQTGDGETCWYQLPSFRQRYPEYRGLSDAELETKLYAAVGRPLPAARPAHSLTTLLNWIGIFAAVPLGMLIIGAAIGWAFSGFSAPTTETRHKLYHGA